MQPKNNTKELMLEFFKGSNIEDKNGVLTINNAPKSFEDFIGKKAPYVLVFDFDKHNKLADSELIVKGSYFLSAIRDYMRTKGQTTLVKMNIKFEEPKIQSIGLGNCKIIEVNKKEGYSFIPEFTFLSICQYLNDKKQFMNKIRIKDGNILDMNLGKLTRGDAADIGEVEVFNEYKAAKIKLQEMISEKTKEIRYNLSIKLEKELKRIKEYYGNQIKESDEEVERCLEKIKLLEAKFKHTYFDREALILKRMIREYNDRLVKLKEQGHKERLKKEELFHVNDELDKYALSVNHSLANINLIYYKNCTYTLKLKSSKSDSIKILEIVYDPFFKKFEPLTCSSCNELLNKINISSTGKIVCAKCLSNSKGKK